MKKLMLAMAMAAVLTGCGGEPTIDATSEEALRKSIVEVSLPLSEEDRVRLANAVLIIMTAEVTVAPDLAKFPEIARLKLHGLTGAQAIALAEKIVAEKNERAAIEREKASALLADLAADEREEQQVRKLAQLDAEIERKTRQAREWKQRVAAREKDAAELRSKILVNAVRIQRLEHPSLPHLSKNDIAVTLTNKSDQAISQIRFRGRIVVNGRVTAYDEGNLITRPTLGIEPGETLTITNHAQELTETLKAVPPESAEYKLELVPVYAEDDKGNVLWDGVIPQRHIGRHQDDA